MLYLALRSANPQWRWLASIPELADGIGFTIHLA
jgi:hypothetical protein